MKVATEILRKQVYLLSCYNLIDSEEKKNQLKLLRVFPVTHHKKLTSLYVSQDNAYTKLCKHREISGFYWEFMDLHTYSPII